MGQHQIVKKLQEEFDRELNSEAQVVYVLVEVGKLLEHDKAKAKYRTINFYRNWVVHTKVSESTLAHELIHTFDRYIIDNNADSSKTLKDFVSPQTLRIELREYLKTPHGLTFPSCEDGILWKRFVKYLARVISQTPLCTKRKASQPTQYVESITVSRSRNQQKRAMLTWEAKCHTTPPSGVKTTLDVVLLEDIDVIMLEAHPKPSCK